MHLCSLGQVLRGKCNDFPSVALSLPAPGVVRGVWEGCKEIPAPILSHRAIRRREELAESASHTPTGLSADHAGVS